MLQVGKVTFVCRELNKEADRLANEAIDEARDKPARS